MPLQISPPRYIKHVLFFPGMTRNFRLLKTENPFVALHLENTVCSFVHMSTFINSIYMIQGVLELYKWTWESKNLIFKCSFSLILLKLQTFELLFAIAVLQYISPVWKFKLQLYLLSSYYLTRLNEPNKLTCIQNHFTDSECTLFCHLLSV